MPLPPHFAVSAPAHLVGFVTLFAALLVLKCCLLFVIVSVRVVLLAFFFCCNDNIVVAGAACRTTQLDGLLLNIHLLFTWLCRRLLLLLLLLPLVPLVLLPPRFESRIQRVGHGISKRWRRLQMKLEVDAV